MKEQEAKSTSIAYKQTLMKKAKRVQSIMLRFPGSIFDGIEGVGIYVTKGGKEYEFEFRGK